MASSIEPESFQRRKSACTRPARVAPSRQCESSRPPSARRIDLWARGLCVGRDRRDERGGDDPAGTTSDRMRCASIPPRRHSRASVSMTVYVPVRRRGAQIFIGGSVAGRRPARRPSRGGHDRSAGCRGSGHPPSLHRRGANSRRKKIHREDRRHNPSARGHARRARRGASARIHSRGTRHHAVTLLGRGPLDHVLVVPHADRQIRAARRPALERRAESAGVPKGRGEEGEKEERTIRASKGEGEVGWERKEA